MKKLPLFVGALLLLAMGVSVVVGVRYARREAIRSTAIGRLCQLRLALQSYEDVYGSLPPQVVKDAEGNPTLSWLAAVLPYCEQIPLYEQLDLAKRWDAVENVGAIEAGERYWPWFSRDGHFACVLTSPESIWNSQTVSSRVRLEQFPDSIVFVTVPVEDVHPLQPFAVDEEDLFRAIKNGADALFIRCDGAYGIVRLDGNKLVYWPTREPNRSDQGAGASRK